MLARGERLAEFLNYEEAAETTEELLRQMVTVQGLLDRFVAEGLHVQRKPVPLEDSFRDTGLWCWWASDKRVVALLPEINQMLTRYRWKVDWTPVRVSHLGLATVPLVLKNPLRVGSGHFFGYMLRDCLEDRSLGRVRRCPSPLCALWFMASREDQQHCSKRCRNQCGVRSTPATWAAYHRDRRKKEKIREQIEQLQTKMSTSKLSDRKRLQIEIANLGAEYKSLLQKKEGQRHAKK